MKPLSLLACIALASTASAQFSVSGPGDFIPQSGTGNPAGWDTANLDYDFTATDIPGTSTVNVPVAVTCIDSVEIQGLTHTWMGDLQAVLVDPTGKGYCIWLRPALPPSVTCCGNSGDLIVGTYTFVSPGQGQGPLPQAGDAVPGIYDQSWDTGAGVVWPDGDENVFNTPFDQVTGPAGTWTLNIYDWAALDSGSFTGWTLNGNGCAGGTIGTNFGCPTTVANSSGGPADIAATGSDVAADNNVTLSTTGMPTSQFGYYLNSLNQNANGFNPPGSQGNLCIGPAGLGRYNASVFNSGANGEASLMLDLTMTPTPAGNVSVQAGETWYFTTWFRDNNPGSTSNFSDAVCITFL